MSGSVSVLDNDSDPEGDVFSLTSSANGTHGSVSCNDGETCSYTPDDNYSGSDSFSYTVADDKGATSSGKVDVTVSASNDPPVAVDDDLMTAQDTARTVADLTNDTDVDGDVLTVTASSQGTHGQVTCSGGGNCTYSPDAGYSGPDSFNYSISDANGALSSATVNVTVNDATLPAPACSGVTVNPGPAVQTAIDANPEGATFCFNPGIYALGAPLSPKAGQSFVGGPGVILDGTGGFENNRDYGIRLLQQGDANGIRTDHPSSQGAHVVENNDVHDNTIVMSTGYTGASRVGKTGSAIFSGPRTTGSTTTPTLSGRRRVSRFAG